MFFKFIRERKNYIIDYEKSFKLFKANKTLYRIMATRDFDDVKAGDYGGFIESEKNLSQFGNCWVYDNALVYGNAKIKGNSKIKGLSEIYDNAVIQDYAVIDGIINVYNDSVIKDNSIIKGIVSVFGKSLIKGNTKISDTVSICDDIIDNNFSVLYNKYKYMDMVM